MARFSHLLTEILTVQPRGTPASDASGDPLWGTKVTLLSMIKQESKLIVSPDGVERRATHVIWTDTPITQTSRVWLPGTDTSKDELGLKILDTNIYTAPDGLVIYETLL